MERRSIAKLAAQVGGTKLPPHISIKDNVFAAVDDAGNRVHIGPTLHCVILDMNEKMSRLFWGVDAVYDEDNQSPPLCFSDNGIAPSKRSLEPQAISCKPDRDGITGCRWSVWGSGRSKKTGEGIPACNNGIKLALMLVKLKGKEGKEWIPAIEKSPGAVFFFRVPPASLGAIASYGKTIAGMGKIPELPWTGETDIPSDVPYYITRVTFRGTGTVQFEAVDYINERIDSVVGAIDQYKVDISIGRDDEPITGLPSPEPQAKLPEPELNVNPFATPQPQPSVAPGRKPRGRPRKDNGAPATPFEPKPNPSIVTAEEVREHAAREREEAKEAQQFGGITESAPEPPEDVLDQFMNLDLK